jgi:DNA-binding MarR family transcriptional regulator
MQRWREKLEQAHLDGSDFRLTDYPMHYFAAIQKRNQVNLDRMLARIDMSPLDWRILAALHDRGSMTINDLVDLTVFDRFKVSRGVNSLMERGMIDEATGSSDRRRRRVALTDRGLGGYRQALAIVARAYIANFEGLTDEEFAQLLNLLQRIKDNVQRVEVY